MDATWLKNMSRNGKNGNYYNPSRVLKNNTRPQQIAATKVYRGRDDGLLGVGTICCTQMGINVAPAGAT